MILVNLLTTRYFGCKEKGCTATAVKDRARCEPHLKAACVQAKRRRDRCQKEGICICCRLPATHGVYCETHHDMSRNTQAKIAQSRRTAGLCVGCGKEPRPGKVTCQECSDINAKRWHKAHRQRLDSGLCIYCGGLITKTVGRARLACAECRETRQGYNSTLGNRFSRSKKSSSALKHGWTLTLEDYRSLVIQPCFYCGLANESDTCGLDRLDNKQGYHKHNVVSCCTECNMVRNNIFTPEEMKILGQAVRQIKLARKTATGNNP